MVRVLLVAAMRQPVLRAVQAVEKAGLRPVRVDLAGLALLRLASAGRMPPGVAEARVDIGAEVTTVVVQVTVLPRFVRMLAGEGGLKLTRALVERLGVQPRGGRGAQASARHLDRRRLRPRNPSDRDARVVIDRVTDGTLTAVRSSLDFFLGNAADVDGLGRVVLTGGGAHLPRPRSSGLSDALEHPGRARRPAGRHHDLDRRRPTRRPPCTPPSPSLPAWAWRRWRDGDDHLGRTEPAGR